VIQISMHCITLPTRGYVAVGNLGKIATSSDTQTWTQRGGFGDSSVFCVAYGNNQYVAAGASGKLATSTDGVTWTQQASSFGASAILAVTYSTSASLMDCCRCFWKTCYFY
jgi:hypothetical protein